MKIPKIFADTIQKAGLVPSQHNLIVEESKLFFAVKIWMGSSLFRLLLWLESLSSGSLLESGTEEIDFKINAVHHFFLIAMGNPAISAWRRKVIEKGLKVADDGICGKCRHLILNKGYLNVHDDYCCT